jgi:hypothetical protein
MNNVNTSISEFTRGPLQEVLRAARCTSVFLRRFWPTSQYTNRKEGNKKDRERERKWKKITYIIEGETIQLNMKSGDISFEFLNEVFLM